MGAKARGAAARRKGAELEEAFASWMRSELGYASTQRGVLINGKGSVRPYEVDVHGQIHHVHMRVLTFVIVVLSLAGAFIAWRDLASGSRSTDGALTTIMALGLGYLTKQMTTVHAWVECKNLKTTVKRDDVTLLAGKVRLVKARWWPAWAPERVMIVSGAGFDVDALGTARTEGIECYERDGQGFRRVP